MKYDLTLIISGIRNSGWSSIYDQMKRSCNRHTFEIIFCSPYELPDELKDKKNIKFIQDFGSPSRCIQLSSTKAEGEYIAILSDDGIITEESFSNVIDDIKNSNDPYKNIMALRYTEGYNFKANINDFCLSYWNARFHGDLRIDGIEEDWKLCIMFLMNTERFRELGGLDCRFEHYNMNLHDLAFRAQRDGSKIIVSREFVSAQDFQPDGNSPIIRAYHENDKPLFYSIYFSKHTAQQRPIKINYDNWKDQPPKWARRFGG